MSHLFQVGAGSGGIVVFDLLARDPRITRVTLVDPDVYKPHNVYRHLFPASAVGRTKAELAAEWLRERRPELLVDVLPIDLTAPENQLKLEAVVADCDVGVCAADNEPAKYHFDQLMRKHRKPWTLGEVLSGGIGGWVHRFTLEGPCYGCVASHLQRTVTDAPAAPPPDYNDPNGPVRETTIPASKASITAIASLHALVTLELLTPSPLRGEGWGGGEKLTEVGDERPLGESSTPHPNPPPQGGRGQEADFTSLLMTLARVPEVFDDPYRTVRFRVPRSLTCLVCSTVPVASGEDLDAALDQALGRLGHG